MLKLLAVMTQDDRYNLKIPDSEKGETTMCTVLDRVENIGIQKGIQIGKQEGIQLGKQEGIQLGKQEGIQLGKQEGIQLGKQEGIQLGKQEGIQIGQQQLLDRFLENLSLEDLAKFTNIPLAELQQFIGRSDK